MIMTIDLTPIFQAIITLLAALVTYKLIPWIKSKTTAQQQNNLRAMVRVMVFAAEQLYGAGEGKQKLEYVREQLRKAGFDADVNEIEAAVAEYFGHIWDDNGNIITIYGGEPKPAEEEPAEDSPGIVHQPPDEAAAEPQE